VRASIHTEKYNHREKSHLMGSVLRKNAHSRFHVYSLEWSPQRISLFVDNHCTLTYARPKDEGAVPDSKVWPFDQRFHLVLNVAVGGNWAGQHGVDDSMFPTSLEVAYVRVYQRPEPWRDLRAATDGGAAASRDASVADGSSGRTSVRV
jgi:beta-glucanase (GH16 family)